MKRKQKRPAQAGQVERMVSRHARLWRDDSGMLDEVRSDWPVTLVVRGSGYTRPGSVACHLTDTRNGYIVRFPAHSSIEQDKYVCLDYDDARNLVLALTPHAKALGFAG